MAKKATYYVLVVEGGVEPSLSDPFKSWEDRDKEAKKVRNEGVDGQGDPEENGVFWLDVTADGKVQVGAYSNGFMESEDEKEDKAEQQRRDEKNGLYPEHADDAN
jgi:hypothetical protein